MTTDGTDRKKAYAALAASSVLGELSAPFLDRLAACGSPVSLDAGVLLFQAGDEGDAAYVLIAGELEVRTSAIDGKVLRFTTIEPGGLVGEMAVLDGGARSADVAAVRRSVLWRIPRQALLDSLMAEPAAALALIAVLGRRLRAGNAALEQITRLDLAGRLAMLLLAERNRQGLVALTQTEIARRLSCSREQVNRRLNGWSRDGWVGLGPSGVQVLSEAALEALARS